MNSAIFTTSKFIQQRSCIQFCLRHGISADFGDQTLSLKNVYKWYNKFKAGRESVEKNVISNRPKTSTDEQLIKKVKEIVLGNRRMTIRDIADSCVKLFAKRGR